MKSYKVRWTDETGHRTSVTAYDEPSAEQRAEALRAEGHDDAEVYAVHPLTTEPLKAS
ncbi:hypothetical protein OG709_30160 [Streptomyces sp. NBC_01267]|uniref:hypothetical protein n=1 Tax=Streptomyces sp. NBC_01267 TaxID=2903805 RepID=UPI002E36F2B7|nr:hypothetical protein [Streptomyces sp. NBC_01267]